MSSKTLNQHQIFVSYSHENADWIRTLGLDKSPRDDATFWIDKNRLKPGDRWNSEAQPALERATAAVLLVSKPFLESSAIREYELPVLTNRFKSREISVVFVPIGDVSTEEVGRSFGIDDMQNIISIPGWDDPLPTVADVEPRDDLRERIISAALDSGEVQNLRRGIPSKYRLGRCLGRGPLGEIFVAHDTQLRRTVAVKLLHKTGGSRYFKDSVRKVANATDHTHILSVYGAYLDADPPHYVGQFVEGRSLRSIMDEVYGGDPLPIEHVQELVPAIGAAVSHAHGAEVDSLNIKPSNIIVSDFDCPTRRTYYLDLSSYREEDLLRGEGWLDGGKEVLYVPPEYRGSGSLRDRHVPQKADQYRLGAMTYEMLVGSRRFEELAQPLRERGFEPRSWRWPALASERENCLAYVCEVVDRMVRSDPGERYDTVAAAVAAIDRADLDVETVRDSYRRLMASEDKQVDFFRSFYRNFRERFPKAKKLFKQRGFGPLPKAGPIDKNWQRQFQALKEAVLLLAVFNAFHEEGREPNILTRIVEAHAKMGVPASMYESFGEVLIDTVLAKDRHRRLDEEDLRRAWSAAIRPGIEYMTRKTLQIERTGG